MLDSIRTQIADHLSAKNVLNYYKIYTATQWYCKEELQNFQLRKLKVLLNHCYKNVPFYKSIIENIGLDINNIRNQDILFYFPVITKQTILDNYDAFIPNNVAKLQNVKKSQTGGTTGRILFKRTDANVRSSTWGSFKRFYDWMGIKESDAKLKLMGGHISNPSFRDKLKEKFNDRLFNEYSFDPYDNSDKNVNAIRQILQKKDIKLIRSYSQHLYNLAQQFNSNKERFNVKSIMTTAEPLMQEQRLLFKKVFNAGSFDQYGCGEIGAIAFECDKHEGLHITEERVIVELDEENNMIFTDLDNYAMPYIRYKNDDQAILSDEPCSCGRTHRLIKNILGRSCDYITGVNRKSLHWAYFWHLMFDTEIAHKRNLIKFQIHQTDAENISIRTVGNELTEDDQKIIRNYMFEKLGPMKISFVNEKDIENAKSGKYRPVVNDMLLYK